MNLEDVEPIGIALIALVSVAFLVIIVVLLRKLITRPGK